MKKSLTQQVWGEEKIVSSQYLAMPALIPMVAKELQKNGCSVITASRDAVMNIVKASVKSSKKHSTMLVDDTRPSLLCTAKQETSVIHTASAHFIRYVTSVKCNMSGL